MNETRYPVPATWPGQPEEWRRLVRAADHQCEYLRANRVCPGIDGQVRDATGAPLCCPAHGLLQGTPEAYAHLVFQLRRRVRVAASEWDPAADPDAVTSRREG